MADHDPQLNDPLGDSGADPVDAARMSFGDHLDELRSCLIRALVGVGLAATVALVFGKTVLAILFWPLFMVQRANGMQPRLQSLSPTDAFAAYFKMSLLAGLILSMPWVLHQAWRFVASGLYPRERQFATKLTWASSGLFAIGVLFLYFLVLPIILQFFITFNRDFEVGMGEPSSFYRSLLQVADAPPVATGIESSLEIPILQGDPPANGPNLYVDAPHDRLVVRSSDRVWSIPLEPGATAPAIYSEFAIDPYIGFVLQLGLAFGLAFETPMIVCFLAWTNLVSVSTMVAARRYILFGIVVVAAVLTPPDVLSQMLLALPMYLLFELGIRLAKARKPRIGTTD
jgi:sec-independent protein translocase protein TatC